MSLFNPDQEAYMASLGRMKDEEKCYCGWDRFGECYHCKRSDFAKDKTLADRHKLACPYCDNYPFDDSGKIVHRIYFPQSTNET